jgi:hypothetical protein
MFYTQMMPESLRLKYAFSAISLTRNRANRITL